MTCANGHETSAALRFCGECGIPILPETELCASGHINPRQNKFCGDCGAPVAPPAAAGIDGSTGRWTVDPTHRHHFRYLKGTAWTQHVADVGDGTIGIDPLPRSSSSRAETWAGILIGVILLILVVGAISAAAVMFSGSDQASPDAMQAQPSVAHPTGVPPAQYLPTPTAFRPLAVIGAPCPPSSVNGVQKDGAIAYCEPLGDDHNIYMWSMYPGAIESPYSPETPLRERDDLSIAVCMMQRVLPREACVAELPR